MGLFWPLDEFLFKGKTSRLFKGPPYTRDLTLVRLEPFHQNLSVYLPTTSTNKTKTRRKIMSHEHRNSSDQATRDSILGRALIALVDCGSVYAEQAKEATQKIEDLKSRYPGRSVSSWPKHRLEEYKRYLGQAQFYWKGQLDLINPRAHLHFQAGFSNLISDEGQLHDILTEKLRTSKQLQDLVSRLISEAEEREY